MQMILLWALSIVTMCFAILILAWKLKEPYSQEEKDYDAFCDYDNARRRQRAEQWNPKA